MITVIKKIIIIKEKEGKRQGKKKACPTRLDPGTFAPTLRFTTRPRGLSYPEVAKSFYLNKNDVIITVNTSNLVLNMQNIFRKET